MRMFKMILLTAFFLGFALFHEGTAFAHGEDKPGPHGGVIRMPGAFHTEVVHIAPNQIRIYLLDMNWKNPTVVDSSVEVTFGDKARARCEKESESFLCSFPENVGLKKPGEISVRVVRGKQKGFVAKYKTPFKH